MLAPYIITEFANAILRMSDKKWLRGIAPTKLFNMAQTNTGASFIVYIAVLLILGVVMMQIQMRLLHFPIGGIAFPIGGSNAMVVRQEFHQPMKQDRIPVDGLVQ